MGKLKRKVVKEINDALLFDIQTGDKVSGTVKFIADKDNSHITEVNEIVSSGKKRIFPTFRYTKEEYESGVKDNNVFCKIKKFDNKEYYILHNAQYNDTLTIPVTENSYLDKCFISDNMYLVIYDFGIDVLTFIVEANNMTIVNDSIYSRRLDEIVKCEYLGKGNLNETVFLAKCKIDKMEKKIVKIRK